MGRWIKRGMMALCLAAVVGAGAYYSHLDNQFQFGPPDDRSAWTGQNASVNTGQLAYVQRDVTAAMEIWREVASDGSARADDRTEALQLLSRTSWRVFQNIEDGISYALSADDIDNTNAANAVALSNAYRAAQNFDAALNAARIAMARASDPLDQNDAALAFGRAATAAVHGLRLDEQSQSDRNILREAQTSLAPFFMAPPANLETSQLALEIAVRLDDGPAMLQAWGSYYHSPTGISSTADQSEPAAHLRNELPRWQGPEASLEARRNVALALAHSHFYEEARLVASDQRSPHTQTLMAQEEITDALAAGTFFDGLAQHTNEYYRVIAEGNSSSVLFQALLYLEYRTGRIDLEREAWNALSAFVDRGNYSHDAFMAEMSDRFQLYFSEGTTSGVPDVHAGHRVLDTTVVADQYGRTADLGFVVVGRMISNGYESWLWDGRMQHGGWANDTAIYQVRAAYADGPLRRWHQITNPALRQERMDEIVRLTAEDATTAATTPITYFAGMAARLRWQGLNGILEDARATHAPELVRQAFILDFGNTTFQYSIFAHEGRHALDKNFAEARIREDNAELEFRAKLSEVVFSNRPRLAFGAIFNPNMGSDTSHGIANQRIAEGLAIWMQAHASEIGGLDMGQPLLPQFDLLTDDQIRTAARSLDPWAEDVSDGLSTNAATN